MEYDPRTLILTCIFLASKVEDEIINIADLERGTAESKVSSFNETEILTMEMPLLQGLKFNLWVSHPHRPLQAFLDRILPYCDNAQGMEAAMTHAIALAI
ncbi:unnamed protein product [Chrysoparadoxa australica]